MICLEGLHGAEMVGLVIDSIEKVILELTRSGRALVEEIGHPFTYMPQFRGQAQIH
jgi:hypothetical protein